MSSSFWVIFLGVPLAVLLLYLALATCHLLALAVSYFVTKERKPGSADPVNRFAVIVPAHNEEMLIGNLCESLLEVDYPRGRFEIYVVADNCISGLYRGKKWVRTDRHKPD